jgi:hypothetical protein
MSGVRIAEYIDSASYTPARARYQVPTKSATCLTQPALDLSETYTSGWCDLRQRSPHRNEWRGPSGPELERERTLMQKHSEAVYRK